MHRILCLLTGTLVSLIFWGCGPRASEKSLSKTPAPNQLVAKVNNTLLTWAEMETRAMGFMKDDIETHHLIIPSNRIDEAKIYFRHQSINAFVYKTIMLTEAAKQNISLTQKDRQDGLLLLANQLKSRNWTTNDFFLKGPMKESNMRREFEDGQIIDKLLLLNVRNHITVTDKEITDMMVAINATNNLKHAKLEQLQKKLLDGADFAEVARTVSECPSAKNGGALGEFTRGKIDKRLEDAAFTQKVGAIGPIITTHLGYHLVKVTSRLPAHAATKSTPAIPETVRASHILLKTIDIDRKKIANSILIARYKEGAKRFFLELKGKAKIKCFLYPDMRF